MSAIGINYTVETTMVTEQCCNCGMLFAVTSDYQKRRRQDRARFFCPEGHGQSYSGETEAEKLRRERDRLKQDAARLEDQIRRERENAAFGPSWPNKPTPGSLGELVLIDLPAALDEIERLRGSLEYIKAQSVSKAYATSPAMALNVIRANAEAALDNDFQTTVAEARSFLSRMGGRK